MFKISYYSFLGVVQAHRYIYILRFDMVLVSNMESLTDLNMFSLAERSYHIFLSLGTSSVFVFGKSFPKRNLCCDEGEDIVQKEIPRRTDCDSDNVRTDTYFRTLTFCSVGDESLNNNDYNITVVMESEIADSL